MRTSRAKRGGKRVASGRANAPVGVPEITREMIAAGGNALLTSRGDLFDLLSDQSAQLIAISVFEAMEACRAEESHVQGLKRTYAKRLDRQREAARTVRVESD